MSEINKISSRRIFHIVSGVFLVISIGVFAALGISQQYQDLKTTYELADKTTAFLKNECLKFDDYDRGKTAASLQDLLDTASALKDFIPYSAIEDSEFLNSFMHTEHVGGIIVLDKDLSPVALTDIDHGDTFSMWKPLLERDSVRDILEHPEKSYVDTVTVNNIPYDLAIVANDEGSRLIMCYASTVKPVSDPYEYTIDSILANNNFYKDPTVVITNSKKVLSTNNAYVQSLDNEELYNIDSSINWQNDRLTQFKYNDETWYGLRRACGSYFLYAVYPSNEVFSNRTDIIANGFMIYLLFCLVYLTIQRSFDRRDIHKMEKQLRIIDAISTSYSSTFLLHLDTGVLEPLRVSERLRKYFNAHSGPDDFLEYMSENFTAPESRNTLREFMDRTTMSERVKGKQFIGTEIRDMNGLWFSMLLIPQKYNDNGDLHAVIVTTRDVTDMKQAEELSFKDKLTGLRNRNYMESHTRKSVRAGDFPVSLIMADCNYLKRTNDTFGHEYGDKLLKRIADIIKETIPENYIAMRVGGDEFLILCPQCPAEKASELVDDMRRLLDARSDETITLSASFGIHTVEAPAENGEFSFKDAYEMADRAMYIDKQAAHAAGQTGRGGAHF